MNESSVTQRDITFFSIFVKVKKVIEILFTFKRIKKGIEFCFESGDISFAQVCCEEIKS